MSQGSEPGVNDPLSQELQTRHPGLGDEIRGAIRTLRKIQQIADPGSKVPLDNAGIDATASEPVGSHGQLLACSESFGRYQIVRLLGQGAMGAVYLAYDPQLERHVALKTPFLGDNPSTIERFFREARAAAQIRSPYVCTVFDVGQTAGIYYVSMAFIDGQPLDRAIADGRIKDLQQIAHITQKIARGIQKAHEHGIMHRDLKPANIMIDADGEPVVMDFGLARKVDEETLVTVPGKILGTPAYMSPEQVEGDPKKIGHATDIYSLGVVLYQMLTGHVPFQGSVASVLHKISSGQPPKPSSVNTALAADAPLEQICLKMMAKLAAERFPTMAAAAEALDQALPREAPAVVQPSKWTKVSGAVKRLFARGPKPTPAKPTPSKAVEPAPDQSGTQLTVDSDVGVKPVAETPDLGGTQLTLESGSIDAPNPAAADLSATQMTVDSDAIGKSISALDRTAES